MIHSLTFLICLLSLASGFTLSVTAQHSSTALSAMSASLVEPSQRDVEYGQNVAQYLVDLHDNKGTFDFCGGMMFQLMLSEKLRDHLVGVSAGNGEQPKIVDASKSRMFNIADYKKSADADNVSIFHGRELRQIPSAAGGFGFVLQLSMANENDPDGWSSEEIGTYDGWGHDSGRKWRKALDYEAEGFKDFKQKFGEKAFGLNHRFYLHFDAANRMWLSAEDGCEGTPALSGNPISRLFGF
jgi:hypothetical protein